MFYLSDVFFSLLIVSIIIPRTAEDSAQLAWLLPAVPMVFTASLNYGDGSHLIDHAQLLRNTAITRLERSEAPPIGLLLRDECLAVVFPLEVRRLEEASGESLERQTLPEAMLGVARDSRGRQTFLYSADSVFLYNGHCSGRVAL